MDLQFQWTLLIQTKIRQWPDFKCIWTEITLLVIPWHGIKLIDAKYNPDLCSRQKRNAIVGKCIFIHVYFGGNVKAEWTQIRCFVGHAELNIFCQWL